jgi:hypothetical protein
LLWTGTADSAVDLNPTNLPTFNESVAVGTNGRQQVGYGSGPGFPVVQALLWNGTANSTVNLHALLPPGFMGSEAFTIDPAGDVFGTADGVGTFTAIEWVPVPEPAALLAIAGGALLLRRRIPGRRRTTAESA